MMGLGLILLPGIGSLASLAMRLPAAAFGWAAFSLLAWFWLLSPGDRQWARSLLPRSGRKAAAP